MQTKQETFMNFFSFITAQLHLHTVLLWPTYFCQHCASFWDIIMTTFLMSIVEPHFHFSLCSIIQITVKSSCSRLRNGDMSSLHLHVYCSSSESCRRKMSKNENISVIQDSLMNLGKFVCFLKRKKK